MLAFRIPEVRNFMQSFLREGVFDDFSFLEGTLSLETVFSFDGKLLPGYFSEEELETLGMKDQRYISWKLERQRIDSILRGSHTPGFFQFTLGRRKEDGSCQQFTVRYKNAELTLTTGVSQIEFTLSRAAEHSWDEEFTSILRERGLPFENIG